MQRNNTGLRSRGFGRSAFLHLATAGLLVALGTSFALASTETIRITKVAADEYYVVSPPSSESQCLPDTRLFPVTTGAVSMFKKILASQRVIYDYVEFLCKAEIYVGPEDTCSVYKLSGCTCDMGCNQLSLP